MVTLSSGLGTQDLPSGRRVSMKARGGTWEERFQCTCGKTSALKGPQSRNQQGEISRGVAEKQQELRIRDGPDRMHGSP